MCFGFLYKWCTCTMLVQGKCLDKQANFSSSTKHRLNRKCSQTHTQKKEEKFEFENVRHTTTYHHFLLAFSFANTHSADGMKISWKTTNCSIIISQGVNVLRRYFTYHFTSWKKRKFIRIAMDVIKITPVRCWVVIKHF